MATFTFYLEVYNNSYKNTLENCNQHLNKTTKYNFVPFFVHLGLWMFKMVYYLPFIILPELLSKQL